MAGDPDPLANELGRLRASTPTTSPRFTDEVMRQIAARRVRAPGLLSRLAQRLLTERTVTLRFRPAHLVGAAALGALVVVGMRAHPSAAPVREAATAAPAREAATAAPVREGAPDAPVLVRFALAAPGAQQVSVAGDFNGWRPDTTPLERRPDGTWAVMLPLGPGSWSYSFVVDGKWVEDPLADAYREDGFGGKNAIVRIGG
jgi:hypothetical protein